MVLEVYDYHWFRYILPVGATFNSAHPTFAITVERTNVFGLRVIKEDVYGLVMEDDLEVEFKLSTAEADSLIKRSRGYMGKVDNKTVVKGSSLDAMLSNGYNDGARDRAKDEIENNLPSQNPNTPNAVVVPQHNKKRTPQVGAKISFSLLKEETRIMDGVIKPPSEVLKDLLKKAVKLLGIKASANIDSSKIVLAESKRVSTSLITRHQRGVRSRVFCVLNMNQLSRIGKGKVTAELIAQVVTHEFAHYIYTHTIKNSDRALFKKTVAGLAIHKDQLSHTGYTYPWHDEQFAILAESMVHGRCARGIVSLLGWEIVEPYFVNNFIDIDSGEYQGEAASWDE